MSESFEETARVPPDSIECSIAGLPEASGEFDVARGGDVDALGAEEAELRLEPAAPRERDAAPSYSLGLFKNPSLLPMPPRVTWMMGTISLRI